MQEWMRNIKDKQRRFNINTNSWGRILKQRNRTGTKNYNLNKLFWNKKEN